MEKVKFFDTTLRDGEQSPGCSMTAPEKLTLAKQLERLGVNTIEAGFAASSPGDFESVRDIGQQIQNSTVVSLCRAIKNDIDSAIEALSDANNWGIQCSSCEAVDSLEGGTANSGDSVDRRQELAFVKWTKNTLENVIPNRPTPRMNLSQKSE